MPCGRAMWVSSEQVRWPAYEDAVSTKRRRVGWFGSHGPYLGVDGGKSFRWAVGSGQEGEAQISWRVESCIDDAGALLEEAGSAELAIAGQKSSIGPLVVHRCRAKGG